MATTTAAAFLLFTALLGAANVAGYNLLADGIPSANQIAAASLAAAFFLGLPHVQQTRSHIGVDLVVSRLPRGLQTIFDVFATALTGLVLATIAWTALAGLERSINTTELAMGSWPFPVWPFRVAAVAGASLAALVALTQVFSKKD